MHKQRPQRAAILQLFSATVLTAAAGFAVEPLVANTVFTAFDTETTGFSPTSDRIVEIGAVKFRGNGEILAATNWLVNPGIPVPFYATEVHGITTGMIADAPSFSGVWKEFSAFCGDSILLAHNAVFDIGFVRAELERAGIKPPPLPVGDTLPLFRAWFPAARSHALGPLAADLGAGKGTYHRAEADSFHMIDILSAGMQNHKQLTIRQMELEMGGFRHLDKRND
jgi:DNA polymerase III epsilon subunit family exonuclease